MRPLPKMFLVTEGIENDENAMKLVDTIKAEQEFYLFDREYNAEKRNLINKGLITVSGTKIAFGIDLNNKKQAVRLYKFKEMIEKRKQLKTRMEKALAEREKLLS